MPSRPVPAVLSLVLAASTLGVTGGTASPAAAASGDRTVTVRSFDGTPITTHLFLADGHRAGQRHPTVLLGPGWSSPGETRRDGATSTTTGSVGTADLLAAGYNVVTWDPRGFGTSGGQANVDSPEYEGRDVRRIISWLARQPEARLDRPGDPRVGMAGASYGGGIQLVTAAIDKRVDAIVPVIAWHSLVSSLFKDGAMKSGWGAVLCGAGIAQGTAGGLVGPDPRTGSLAGEVQQACTEGLARGTVPPEIVHWFAQRGPGRLVRRITAPTLLIQGTVDTLFTLDEASRNYRMLRRAGTPVKMLWFCGGHGACTTEAGDPPIRRATLAWFDRWLKGRRVSTGPGFRWVDQDGRLHAHRAYPPRRMGALRASGSGPVPVVPGVTSGALVAASPSAEGLTIPVPAPRRPAAALGAPRLRLTYAGRATQARTHLYAQLVDLSRGVVLGNQATPLPVILDGRTRTLSRPLEEIAWSVAPGTRLALQVIGSTSTYTRQPAAGLVEVSSAELVVPLHRPGRTPR